MPTPDIDLVLHIRLILLNHEEGLILNKTALTRGPESKGKDPLFLTQPLPPDQYTGLVTV